MHDAFLDNDYFEVHNYNIEVKPWNIDFEQHKTAQTNYTKSYSNLISQDLYETHTDKLGNTYDVVNDVEKVFENHLFIPKVAEKYSVDDIRKMNMDPEKVKRPLKQNEWNVFKPMFEYLILQIKSPIVK